MTILETPRFRILLASAVVLGAAVLGVSLSHDISRVLAARRAVASQDAHLSSELASPPDPRSGAIPVLVELFTSEGCSSCPPADALLARLQREQPVRSADILALEEHVDYWDSFGWHDRFSSHQLTARQSAYVQHFQLDSNYTPQMVVDGTDQFVGNDTDHALRVIAQAARTPKLALSVSALTFDGSHLAGEVSAVASSTPPPDAEVYAALVQPMASTEVLRGENGGRTLHHVSVVRDLQRIGTLAGKTPPSLKFSLNVPKDAASANLRVVVFIQRAGQGPILGAASSRPGAPPTRTTSIAVARPSAARY
jgi:hypothetical protein